MAPTLVSKPFHREGWVYEEKVDGYRMLAYKDGPLIRLISRNGIDHTARYQDLAAALGALPSRPLVLDCELAVCARTSARGSTGCATVTTTSSPPRPS